MPRSDGNIRKSLQRIVFMGTPDFAVPSLEALIRAGYEVEAVFTQPDKPRGRSGKPAFSPVKECAIAHGIPVYQPQRLKEESNLAILRELDPDAIVVAAYGKIIPRDILELPAWGCINVHASLLPKYRGAAPIQWAVISGEKESGVTIMQMGEGLDTGDILSQSVCPLSPDETGGSLFEKLREDGAKLLVSTLRELQEGGITPRKQPEESPTPYSSMLRKDMGLIDWSRSAEEIERLVRGLDPWPSAYTFLKGKQLKLWKTRAAEGGSGDTGTRAGIPGENTGERTASGAADQADDGGERKTDRKGEETACTGGPGSIVRIGKTSFFVQTGRGLLEILELQLEGKKRLDAGAFLRGNTLDESMRLGS